MRLSVLAIGRLAPGPETALTDSYLRQVDGFRTRSRIGPARLRELDAKKPKAGEDQRDAEARLLFEAASSADVIVTLDERGTSLGSQAFADTLGRWRDEGAREAAFLLGGADGHGAAAREQARLILSFGAMTWPHALARAMLAEQLFRAATILAGHPYHRG